MWYLLVIFVVLFIIFSVLLFLMRYSWFQNYGLVLEFLIGIAFTIYLIFLIPNENLQTIVTTILAAVYGGLLTLVGVAWTIRHDKIERNNAEAKHEKERKEDERKKFIPYLQIHNGVGFDCEAKFLIFDCASNLDIEQVEYKVYSISISDFYIKNISLAAVIIKGIMTDSEFHMFDNDYILASGDVCKISSKGDNRYGCNMMPNKIAIIVQDIIGNEYRLDCNVKIKKELHMQSDAQKYCGRIRRWRNYSILGVYLPTLNNKGDS